MNNAETIARVQRRYRVPDNRLTDLLTHLHAQAQPLLGDTVTFRGSLRSEAQPDVQLDYENFDDFYQQAAIGVGQLHGDLSAPWPDRSSIAIWLHRKDAPLEIEVRIKPSRLDEARAAIARLEAAADVTPLADRAESAPAGPSAQLNRRYFSKEPEIERWLGLFEAELAPLVQPSTFRARIRAMGEDAIEHEYLDRATLLAGVPGAVGRVSFSVDASDAPYATAAMDFDIAYQPALRLRALVQAKDKDRVKAAFDRVEAGLNLRRAADDDGSAQDRVGPLVTCFTRGSLDRAWFERICAEIGKLEPWPRWFNGNIHRRPDQSGATSYSAFDRWKNAALENWQSLSELSLDLGGQSFDLYLHLEPKLDFVRVRVKARGAAEADTELQRLLQQFDLERQETEPYSAARTTREFRIDPWNRSAFAEAAKIAFDQFVGRDPVILPRDTFVAESDGRDGEVLTRFGDLASFTQRLVHDKPIVGASIVAKGPKGRILSLAVTENCTRLHVRSSLEPGQFSDLVKALEQRLSLSVRKADAEDSSDDGFWRQFWRLKGLPGHIATLLAGGAVTAIGFLAINAIPSYEIQFQRPHPGSENDAMVDAGCVQVSWTVTRKQWPYQGSSLQEQAGDVSLGPSAGSALPPVKGFRSGQELHIPPGRWTLYVSDPARETVGPVIEVEAKDVDYAGKRAETVARCGNPPTP